jgi:hypothetical protein
MFELNLGARLSRAQLDVEIGEAADLEFTCGGVRWFGECKRPYKIESIPVNLTDACKQLGKRLATSSVAARGLIAISISRPLAAHAPYLECSGEGDLKNVLRDHVSAAVGLIGEQVAGNEQCRQVANLGLLIGHLIMPAWDVAARMPTSVQYSGGGNLCRDKRHDGDRLWAAIERTFQ